MRIDRHCKLERVSGGSTPAPWLDVEKARAYATDGTMAVSVPVEDIDQDNEDSGPIPVDALKHARKVTTARETPLLGITCNGAAMAEGASFTRDRQLRPYNVDAVIPARDKDRPRVTLSIKRLAAIAAALGCDALEIQLGEPDAPVRLDPVMGRGWSKAMVAGVGALMPLSD